MEPSTSTTTTTTSSTAYLSMVRPSPVACTECRKQHLKCDAVKPACSRCLNAGLYCNYLPSRRGGKRKPRSSQSKQQTQKVLEQVDQAFTQIDSPFSHSARSDLAGDQWDRRGNGHQIPTGPSPYESLDLRDANIPNIPVSGSEENFIENTFSDCLNATAQDTPPTWLDRFSPDAVQDDGLLRRASKGPSIGSIQLFYERFHPAHPILVPASAYEDRQYPRFLQRVVQLIGGHVSQLTTHDNDSHDSIIDELDLIDEKSSCVVQARLLYSLFLDFSGRKLEARACLSRAIDIALDIGMHRKEFAMSVTQRNAVEAESLRRTWWELFIVEALMMLPDREAVFRCGSVSYDVELPCEDSVYASGNSIPQPSTLAAFNNRAFFEDESYFSSFSYRIEAVQILTRVLALNRSPEHHHDHLQAVENALVSWASHLPSNKVDVVDTYGEVDEMLFQAYCIIYYAEMLLHLPRSNLRPASPGAGAAHFPSVPSRLPPSFTRHVHDVKTIEASKQLSNLLSVSPRTHQHTPFIICWSLLCARVQLATSRCHSPRCLDHHRNRIILVLGCLKELGETWTIAKGAQSDLKRVSAETFSPGVDNSSHSSPQRRDLSCSENDTSSSPADPAKHCSFFGLNERSPMSQEISSMYLDPTCGDSFLLNSM